ncbi:basic leucine zipper 43-like [Cynara cardunculus var. scolymus]|nr:basic leucine zipper 43-like [Cynara cardunculus var. scolymus]
MSPQMPQFQCMAPEENPSAFSTFSIQDPISVLHMSNLFTNIPDYFSAYPSSLSNNSTSDEADDQQMDMINERKRRRMISNRESARRSRVRKQRQLNELLSQLVRLRTDNHSLVEQLNHLAESHKRAVEENAQLTEESTDIRRMLDEIQLANASTNMLP